MILSYENSNKQRLLEIFDSNVPSYFDPSERQQFIDYLQKVPKNYFVFSRAGRIVGSGGFLFRSKIEGRIVWLMVDQSVHNKGVGRELMHYFEDEIKRQVELKLISLMTSHHTDQFYNKLGYRTIRTENDFWAKGMHLYYMEKQLK